MSECPVCGRKFKSDQARDQHKRDAHHLAYRRDGRKDAAKDVLDSIGEDLPDGAYFALAEELGLEIEDLID